MREPSSRKKPIWLWAGIGGVLAIALGIALLTSGDDAKVTQGTTATGNSTSSAAETQPVTVEGAALPAVPEAGLDTALGLTAPTLSGFGFDGSPIAITPGGRPKMVVFLAHWCVHCNREIPVLQSWAAAGEVLAEIDIIGVSSGVTAQAENYPPSKWLSDMKWTWPVLADSASSDALAAYGAGAFPSFVIVGADGKVKARSSGELPVAELDALVQQALAG